MTLRTRDTADAMEELKVMDLDEADATVLAADETQNEISNAEACASEAENSRWNVRQFLTYVILPVTVMMMAAGVGYLKWQANAVAPGQAAAAEAVSAATEATTAMLSYLADQADQDLTTASGRMTGGFRDEYTTLINDVVIPGAKEQRISAVATVPAAALVSAAADRAEVLVYIDQTTTVGDQPPTVTVSSARVSLEKVGSQWLISGFEPL